MTIKNEHRVIITETDKITHRTRGSDGKKVQNSVIPESINILWLVDNDSAEACELRFPAKNWTESQVMDWLEDNKIKSKKFEPVSPEAKDPCWQSFVNKTTKDLNILINGYIGFEDEDEKKFNDLLEKNKNAKNINVKINSNGGSVFTGFSIFNALKFHEANVEVTIMGVAASIAAYISLAADKIIMPKNTMSMWHRASIGFMRGGTADDLKANATALEKIENLVIGEMKNRIKKSKSEIFDILKKTTWYTAEEALEIGLADEVIEKVEINNYLDFENCGYKVPDEILNRFDVQHGPTSLGVTFKTEDNENWLSKNCKDFLSFLNKNKKETEEMSEQNYEDLKTEFDGIKEIVNNLKTSLGEKDTKIESLETTVNAQATKISELEAKNGTALVDARKEGYRNFLNSCKGKVKPADIENHVKRMEVEYQLDVADFTDENKETKRLDEYKEIIKNSPDIVDLSGGHFANSEDAVERDTEKKRDTRIKEVMKEKSIDYTDALDLVLLEEGAV